jgi:multisubunit Na+/H+ antiporter MnhB subunit
MNSSNVIVAAAARFFTPLTALFAAALLVGGAPGDGVGFVAGLAFALLLMLHALTFGVAAARTAFPTPLARLMLALGVVAACVGAGLPGFVFAPQLIEAGGFAATVAGAALVIHVLFGRAPTLQGAE